MSTAIVVGAGIGGVTAAVALQRCGWQVTVLERAPELGEVGAGISVWPSAVAVLEELGVKGVEKAAAIVQAGRDAQADGRWVVEAADLGVEIPVMIHRAQLHDLITAEFGPAITVRTGYTVTGDHPGRHRRDDQSDDGLRADLVVAADGIRSVIRTALLPGARGTAVLRLHGVPGDCGRGDRRRWRRDLGPGQRFGFARLIDGRIYWYATANQPADQGGDHATVTKAFGDWHDPIPKLLAGSANRAAERHLRPGAAAGPVRPGPRGAARRRRPRDDAEPRPRRLLGDRGRRRPRPAPRREHRSEHCSRRVRRRAPPRDHQAGQAVPGHRPGRSGGEPGGVRDPRRAVQPRRQAGVACGGRRRSGRWNNRGRDHTSAGARDPRCEAHPLRQGPGPVRAGVRRSADGRERPDECLRLDPGARRSRTRARCSPR